MEKGERGALRWDSDVEKVVVVDAGEANEE